MKNRDYSKRTTRPRELSGREYDAMRMGISSALLECLVDSDVRVGQLNAVADRCCEVVLERLQLTCNDKNFNTVREMMRQVLGPSR